MARSRSYTGVHEPLNDELDDVVRRIDSLEAVREQTITRTVGTAETEIRHNLGRVPKLSLIPLADARVWKVRANEKAIYLKASASVSVEIHLR